LIRHAAAIGGAEDFVAVEERVQDDGGLVAPLVLVGSSAVFDLGSFAFGSVENGCDSMSVFSLRR
jgi:hypothetical protein